MLFIEEAHLKKGLVRKFCPSAALVWKVSFQFSPTQTALRLPVREIEKELVARMALNFIKKKLSLVQQVL